MKLSFLSIAVVAASLALPVTASAAPAHGKTGTSKQIKHGKQKPHKPVQPKKQKNG